jgi:hypothetical protein
MNGEPPKPRNPNSTYILRSRIRELFIHTSDFPVTESLLRLSGHGVRTHILRPEINNKAVFEHCSINPLSHLGSVSGIWNLTEVVYFSAQNLALGEGKSFMERLCKLILLTRDKAVR